MKNDESAKSTARAFQFVSLTPEIASDDVAKADHRRLVRSNAASFQWSRHRKRGAKDNHSDDVVDMGSGGEKASPNTDSINLSPEITPNIMQNKAGSRHRNAKPKILSPKHDTDQKTLIIANSGQSSDPIPYLPSPQQYSLVSPMDQAGQQLRFNVHYIIPRLVPEVQKGIENPAADLWVGLALQNPSLYKTWVHCVSVYYFALRGQWKQSELLLSTHSRALKAMSREMENPVRACSDSNILAVWGLAAHGWEKFLPPNHKVPNQGRMRFLQSLDRYSLMKFVPQHLDGLDVLIHMRGGIDRITSEGIAALISYTGIVEATKTLSQPRWSYQTLCRPFAPLKGMRTSLDSKHPLSNLGTGIRHAIEPVVTRPLKNFLDTLQDICSFIVLLHDCDSGGDFPESDGQVADQRNVIQYRLMSLPTSIELQLAPPVQMYEVLRLATTIFSLLVVFPITPSAAPFGRLGTHLRAEIEKLNIYNQSPEKLHLVTWAAVMGGIAAIGTPDRPWYVSTLESLYSHHQFETWEQAKTLLESFLWLRGTNDVDGISLWEELIQLRSYRSQFEIL